MAYLARRLGFYALAAWASITLNFFLPRLMPGDPASAIFARFQGRMDPASIDAMRKSYGLSDEPLINQYFSYLNSILHGDFGTSISAFPTPVIDVIGQALKWTLLLGLVATILSFLIGTTLGILGAWRRQGMVDNVLPPILIFGGSFPYFWLASFLLFLLAFEHNVFPLRHAFADGMRQNWTNFEFLGSVGYHLFLPATTIILVTIGGWMLGMRNAMISVLSEDYMTMAEAKGLSQRRIMFSYAARNALLPNITAFGMALGFVISGALLTETVFSYPGLGWQLITAVRQLDYPLMQGIFLMITFAVLGANFIVDLLYLRLDPRVRAT
jgi:peptide/nickel transport system permease protein